MPSKIASFLRDNSKTGYLLLLSIFVAVLPHSRILLSMSEIGLFLFWLVEGNFKYKYQKIKQSPEVLVFSSIFVLHIVGLIFTENFSYALKDLKIKLPLLLFPLILATSVRLNRKDLNIIIFVFTASLILKTFYGLSKTYFFPEKFIFDGKTLSGSFSHIRYALLLNIAAFSSLYFFLFDKNKRSVKEKIIFISVFVWLSFFVFILRSLTGWAVYFVLLVYSLFFFISEQKRGLLKSVLIFGTVFLFLFSVSYIFFSVKKFYKKDKTDIEKLEKYTVNGNKYLHNFKLKQTENGHYVYLYICEKELKKEWNKLSDINYYDRDKKNQYLRFTLFRYLTSKNLRKDSAGLSKLSEKDIKNIESGMTNCIFANKYSFYPKIYELLWELNAYFSGGSAENKSVSQRFEFLKAAKEIIKRNFWTGTGTGDINDEFKRQYEISQSKLSEKHRLRTHNQYITVFATFGVFGFLWFVFALIYPVIKTKKYKDYLFMISFLTVILSMLNEDTLETQMGATIFAFFLSFFLFFYETDKK